MVLELIPLYPVTSVIIISLMATLVSVLATKWLTNQEHMKSMRKRQKELQEEMKKCQKSGDACAMEKIQTEMLQITGVMLKSSFKPLFVTMIPFLLLFYWMKSTFVPIMGFNWIWWYIGASIAGSIVYRKVLDIA